MQRERTGHSGYTGPVFDCKRHPNIQKEIRLENEQETINGAHIESPIFYGLEVAKFLQALDKILSKDDRIELIPVKNGVKIIHIKREEVKAK